MFLKQNMRVWTELIWLRITKQTALNSCECAIRISDSIKYKVSPLPI